MVSLFDPEPSHPKPLNGAQFSQGMLFNLKPSPEHRWPAGYTPERKEAVTSAMSDVEVSHHQPGEHGDLFLPSSKFFTPSEDNPNRGKWSRSMPDLHAEQAAHGKRKIVDVLARSTVPLEDLEAMPTVHVEKLHGAGGYYARPGHPLTKTRPYEPTVPDPTSEARGRIRLSPEGPRSWQEKALLHELGHHVDYQRDPVAFENPERVPSSGHQVSPALEGAAEGYAFRHHVHRRDEVNTEYAKEAAYTDLHHEPEFQQRFTEVSGKTPAQAMAKPLPPPPPPPHRALGQQFLFSRDAPSDVTQAEGYRDLGQHRLRMDRRGATWRESTEDELDTIKIGRGLEAHGLQKDKRRD